MNKLYLAGLMLLGLSLTSCGEAATGDSGADEGTTEIQAAVAHCKAYGSEFEVADDGHTLLVDGVGGTWGSSKALKKLACMTIELETSDAVVAQMDSTTALMGQQTAEDDGFTYKWSYHPDNGLDIIITD